MTNSIFLNHCLAAMAATMLIIISGFCLNSSDAEAGACYGTLGDDLPAAAEVVALCSSNNIRQIRLYNPNPSVLEALKSNPSISVIVGVENENIIGIAKDPNLAMSWVQNNVVKYGSVNFRCIAVGNEIIPDGGAGSSIGPSVAPAMQNIQSALNAVGIGNKIKVSTALSMGVLGSSHPPSTGVFKPEYQPTFIDPIVKFLTANQSPFLINVYPYFTYLSDTTNNRLDYALFTAPSAVVKDGPYEYQNLFDALVDSVHAALEKAGGANVEVVVTETGWPSAGGTATTIDNARTYNSNLLRSVKNGTPRKPGKPIETYIFDLIDENQKSPEIEKHWGVFLSNKQPKYPLNFG